jgi:hypothetical protein
MKRVGSGLMIAGLLVLGLAIVVFAMTGPATAQGMFPDPNDPAAVWEYISKDSPYTEWGTWPQEEFKGFLPSGAPHTKVVRIFVNDVALGVAAKFPGEMPANSIIVKENFMGETLDSPGELGAITIMYKVPGYNPEGGDWFWAKYKPDGTAEAAGKPAGCIGCHLGIAGNRDGVLRWGFEGEPAVATAAGSEAVAQVLQKMQQPQQMPETGGDLGFASAGMMQVLLIAVAGLVLLLAGYGLRRRATR